MRVYDQTVGVVTGAAGSIGRASVRALSERGVAVVSLDRDRLPTPESELVAEEITLDLLDEAALQDAFDRIASYGTLQHLIAVAGGGDLEELSQEDQATEDLAIFRRAVENNLVIAFAAIRQFVPLLRKAGGNRSITLVGSINAYGGYGAPGYSAAKAGLIGLVNALTPPLGADGIRINCLALGTVDSENLHKLARQRGRELNLSEVAVHIPLQRVLSPEDVAEALCVIALNMKGLTGSTIVLDNGQTHLR